MLPLWLSQANCSTVAPSAATIVGVLQAGRAARHLSNGSQQGSSEA